MFWVSMYVSVASNLNTIMVGPDSIIRSDEVQNSMEPAGRYSAMRNVISGGHGRSVPERKHDVFVCIVSQDPLLDVSG